MLIFDAHLDLSMNALEWNRDLTRPLAEIRRREQGQVDRADRGQGLVSFPEMRRGHVGICIATLIGRYVREGSVLPGWHSPEIAWAVTQGQLAWYRAMEECGELVSVTSKAELCRVVERWVGESPTAAPIGYILSMEGADSILSPRHLERAHAAGLRALGPAHFGPGRYAPGTGATGPLTPRGRELLAQMDALGMVLDVTHLSDEAFWESLDLFSGPIWASHNNCRALVDHPRQFSDRQILAVVERDAVIGVAMDAWMLHSDWVVGRSRPEDAGLTMQRVVEHIDHICQLTGCCRHCGIGSDLDGGYGREQCPVDLGSIADLQKLVGLLAGRGYSPTDTEAIMHGNWLRLLNSIWSD